MADGVDRFGAPIAQDDDGTKWCFIFTFAETTTTWMSNTAYRTASERSCSASTVVPPIPPLVRKLDTILISVAVRLLAPPLFFYIPLCVFPFRAVRPTVVVKISTMLIQCGMFCCEFLPPASFLYCIVASNPHTINLRNVCFNTFLEIFNEYSNQPLKKNWQTGTKPASSAI